MKKYLVVLCMLTCMMFGLTACGEKEAEVPRKLELLAMQYDMSAEAFAIELAEGNFADVQYVYEENLFDSYMMALPDNIFMESALTSYENAIKDMGEITEIGESTVEFSQLEAVVEMEVSGTEKDALVEVVFDEEGNVTSFAVNVKYSFGESMTKAALNTLLGMGTVFAVLILICFIIDGFKLISKVEAMLKNKKASQKEIKEEAVNNTIAQIEEREELSDDMELVAVIAAAIASYEGTSTDGFVVRSIRKANRNKWLNA